MKIGYREVFDRNEYAGSLSKDDLKGLVVEITGLEAKDQLVGLICRTFEMLKSFADFDKKLPAQKGEELVDTGASAAGSGHAGSADRELDVRLSYSINLVLPKTDDPAVFNAIFKALKEHLLRK